MCSEVFCQHPPGAVSWSPSARMNQLESRKREIRPFGSEDTVTATRPAFQVCTRTSSIWHFSRELSAYLAGWIPFAGKCPARLRKHAVSASRSFFRALPAWSQRRRGSVADRCIHHAASTFTIHDDYEANGLTKFPIDAPEQMKCKCFILICLCR